MAESESDRGIRILEERSREKRVTGQSRLSVVVPGADSLYLRHADPGLSAWLPLFFSRSST